MPLPTTIWAPYNGYGEFTDPGVADIVDTLGNNLVDTADNQIVDTGIDLIPLAATSWLVNDGV